MRLLIALNLLAALTSPLGDPAPAATATTATESAARSAAHTTADHAAHAPSRPETAHRCEAVRGKDPAALLFRATPELLTDLRNPIAHPKP